jgi:hypothetical protein
MAMELAALDYDAARILAPTQLDAAIKRAAAAARRCREAGATAQAGYAGGLLGELLGRAQRNDEAAEALRCALADLPEQAAGRDRLVELLASLDVTGSS